MSVVEQSGPPLTWPPGMQEKDKHGLPDNAFLNKMDRFGLNQLSAHRGTDTTNTTTYPTNASVITVLESLRP